MPDPVVSHGRGGQGNIKADPTVYVDGEIIREGTPDHAHGNISTGRGGQGNIGHGSPQVGAQKSPFLHAHRADEEVIPELAMRKSMEDQNYHVGRGGGGNVHHAHKEHHEDKPEKEGLGDKLKKKLFSSDKK